MQIDKTTVYSWLHIGEAYIKYRRELEKINFSDEDGPTKLLFVGRALEYHEKKTVLRNIKEMSYRGFKEFSKGDEAPAPPSKIKVAGNKIYVGRDLAVILAEKLDPKTRAYLEKIIVQAGEALEAGEVLYTTRLYDMLETWFELRDSLEMRLKKVEDTLDGASDREKTAQKKEAAG